MIKNFLKKALFNVDFNKRQSVDVKIELMEINQDLNRSPDGQLLNKIRQPKKAYQNWKIVSYAILKSNLTKQKKDNSEMKIELVKLQKG